MGPAEWENSNRWKAPMLIDSPFVIYETDGHSLKLKAKSNIKNVNLEILQLITTLDFDNCTCQWTYTTCTCNKITYPFARVWWIKNMFVSYGECTDSWFVSIDWG